MPYIKGEVNLTFRRIFAGMLTAVMVLSCAACAKTPASSAGTGSGPEASNGGDNMDEAEKPIMYPQATRC